MVVVSLVLVGTDVFWIYAASLGRMDMMAASLSLVAFSLYVNLRTSNLHWAILLSNLFVCLSGLTHPNGLLGFLVLVFLVLYLDRKRLNLTLVAIALVPYFLGVIGWGIYIMEDLDFFKAQFFTAVFGGNYRGDTIGLEGVLHELVDKYFPAYGVSSLSLTTIGVPILAFFFLCLIVAPFVCRGKLLIWGMLLVPVLGMMLLVGHKAPFYLVWVTPLFLLNSIAVWDALKRRRLASAFFSLAFCYIVVVSLGLTLEKSRANYYHSKYLRDLQQFDGQYYRGGKIYGSGEMAFFYKFDDSTIQDDFDSDSIRGSNQDTMQWEAFTEAGRI